MERKGIFTLMILLLLPVLTFGQSKGKVIQTYIDAPSMKNNLINEPLKQPLAIYLPPSYETNANKHYPVVYFLPGYEDTVAAYIKGYVGGYVFETSTNSNITQGRTKEMIVVVVNGFNRLKGCFFNNSPITGNWEDFVVNDVVSYIDNNYRTIKSANSRALLGLSMGGYGAMHLSMRHPSVFSIAVGECPGLANEVGLMKTTLFSDANIIKKVIAIRTDLAKLSRVDAHKKYIDTISYIFNHGSWELMFSFAYGSAFAADTNLIAPYFPYPFSLDADNKLVRDTAIFKIWEKGFGNLKAKIALYKDSLLKLRGYGIDYGTADFFQWIPEGCSYYDKLLTENGIPHKTWVNGAGHGDAHKQRTEMVELPYIDSLLVYDTENLSDKTDIEKVTFTSQAEVPVVDAANKTVHVKLKSTAVLKTQKPNIYISPGAKLNPATTTAVDLTNGSATYTIISEDGKNTAVWILTSEVVASAVNSIQKTDVFVSPNPAANYVVLNVENVKSAQLFNIDGKCVQVYNSGSNKLLLNRNILKSGLYILKVNTSQGLLSSKLVLE